MAIPAANRNCILVNKERNYLNKLEMLGNVVDKLQLTKKKPRKWKGVTDIGSGSALI